MLKRKTRILRKKPYAPAISAAIFGCCCCCCRRRRAIESTSHKEYACGLDVFLFVIVSNPVEDTSRHSPVHVLPSRVFRPRAGLPSTRAFFVFLAVSSLTAA
jgi:hypothetical protein